MGLRYFKLHLFNMKNVFLAHITLPEIFTPKFYSLIPSQRALVNQLLEKRIILSYSLDMERKHLWVFLEAENDQGVMDILSTFPIIGEVKVDIHELAFFDNAPVHLPELIMN
jgi:hypothetical protein